MSQRVEAQAPVPGGHVVDSVGAPGDAIADERADVARSRERVRMADALHDDALQRLAALKQDLAEVRADPDGGDERLKQIERALDGAVEAVRSVARASHDEALSSMSLPVAVGHIVADAALRGRFRPIVRVADLQLSDADATFVLAAIRELSSNVVVHARATHLAAVVCMWEGTLHLGVSDDGVGTTLEVVARRADEGHLGLAVLRRRTLQRGGAFDLSSGAGAGTAITLTVPVESIGEAKGSRGT